MADDLDAFFDEVSEVEAKVSTKDDDEVHDSAGAEVEVEDEPPTKKVKVNNEVPKQPKQPKPVLPRGVVVAAAASSSTSGAAGGAGAAPNTTATSTNDTARPQKHVVESKSNGTIGPSAPPPRPSQPPLPPPLPPLPTSAATAATSNQQQQQQQQSYQNVDDWPSNGFRLFVGNLANEVNDTELFQHFAAKYSSLQLARIVRDPKKNTSKGFGFISFGEALECARAKREMDQTWLASRPIRIKKYQGSQQPHQSGKGGKQHHNKKKKRR